MATFKDVEHAHLDYQKKVKKYIFVSLAIAIFMGLIASLTSKPSLFSFLMAFIWAGVIVAFFTFIVITFATRKESRAYRSAYKAYFVEQNLKNTFTDLSYDHAAGLSRDLLLATQMINTGDIYSSNDLTTGKYKDVAFTQADARIQVESTDSDGNTTYVTIFKGRFMLYEFPKKFNFRLEVAEKGFGANRIPDKNEKTGRKFERIKLESSEFNKVFKTYAEDGFEAFYLLDPAFINNMLDLAEEYKGKLLLGFTDNKLLVGLKDGKDAFEPPNVFKKLDEKTESDKIAKDIHLITNFVDKLKLNNKLFQ